MAHAAANTGRMVQAGLLTWILPGLGHFVLGQRGLAAVFFLAISFPYFTGLAIGGIKSSINPWSNKWLFLAELGTGGYTSLGLVINNRVGDLDPRHVAALTDPRYREHSLPPAVQAQAAQLISYYPESDVAQIYLATAGLLNVLAILDALTRAQTGGRPTFYHETAHAAAPAEERP